MKHLTDIDIHGKTVLVRLNLNVPIKDGRIIDDFRLKAVLPTIKFVSERAAKTVICGHLGRPKAREESFSFAPVASYFKKIYGNTFSMLSDCIGEDVKEALTVAKPGSILLLENVRFHKGERENDEGFGKALSQLADVFVNDAFGDSYESYASVVRPPMFIPAVAGLRLQDEMAALDKLRANPKHPFVIMVGGVKIAEKMGTIRKLADLADMVLVGGGVGNTLLAAAGHEVRESLVQEDEMEMAKGLLKDLGEKLVLPIDVRVAQKLPDGSINKGSLRFSTVDGLQVGEAIYDIGPRTTQTYLKHVLAAANVFWAGPLGFIEWDQTAEGSLTLLKALAADPNYTVIGGGETASLAASAGLIEKMDFVSTGGSAALKYLSGEPLPGLAALE